MTRLALSCIGDLKDFLKHVGVIKGFSLFFVVVYIPCLPPYLRAL